MTEQERIDREEDAALHREWLDAPDRERERYRKPRRTDHDTARSDYLAGLGVRTGAR